MVLCILDLLDDSSGMAIRGQSRLPEMFYQSTKYLLKPLSERFRLAQESLERRHEDVVARNSLNTGAANE